MESNNNKVQGNVYVKNTIRTSTLFWCILLYYKAKCSQVRIPSKPISEGHVTEIMSILMFLVSFSIKTKLFLCMFLLLFSLLNIDFTTFTFCYFIKYLGNINWEVLPLAKLRKPRLPRYFLL